MLSCNRDRQRQESAIKIIDLPFSLAVSKKRYFLGKFAEPSNKGKSDNISKGTREPYFIKKQCVGIVA
ncbi:hypothetical protein RCL_jg23746.t2 [Rhizophagus clarus]|uniref:Uncharacterized protein n=1 Tax=Rhizophagus clarus TaxID=94130 RepID=A0A8H3LJW7_9GLOM|nr:hypothetical protein RCL_jg23746.t2 [Rhizophagus clarus]